MVRYVIGILSGAFITTFLVFLMNFLIENGEAALQEPRERLILDFVRVKEQEIVNREEVKPKKPPKPETPPPDVPPPPSDDFNPDAGAISVRAPSISANTSLTTIGAPGVADGEYLPIVRVPPQYPQRAAQRGLEGYVDVMFTVSEAGTVVDAVVTYSTSRLFERAALKSLERWKYKAKVVNGQPVATPGVEARVRFQMAEQ